MVAERVKRALPDDVKCFLIEPMSRDDHAIHDLLSGRRRGVLPGATRAALGLIEPLYAHVMRVRNAMYDRNTLRARALGRPTVSVGNLTTGGTGKTPVVAWLAGELLSSGRRPGVLMRGYKGRDGASDEADELRSRLGPVVPVQVDSDRSRGAKALLARWPEVNVFLLDDAHQHRRAGRDFDLVLIDATNPFGFDHVLPRGLLREPVDGGLRRASAVLLTKVDQTDEGAVGAIRRRVESTVPGLAVFESSHDLIRLRGHPGGWHETSWLKGRSISAFCGIGNPLSFRRLLERAGAQVVGWNAFTDHHRYTQTEIDRLYHSADMSGAAILVTTAKDAARLHSLSFDRSRLRVTEVGVKFLPGDDQRLLERIVRAIGRSPV